MCRVRSQLQLRFLLLLLLLFPFSIPNFNCTHTHRVRDTNCDVCNESLSLLRHQHRLSTLCSKSNSFSKKHSTLSCVSWEINMLPYPWVCVCVCALCVWVNRCWFVYLIDSTHAHSHKSIVCELGPLAASPCVCVARNALNFYFRLSQFSPANEKVFFICLAHRVLARSGPFINTGSNYARGTRAGCVSVCCYYVYVTYTQRGLHGVIDKVKFRTFAGNFCGLLHFGFDLPHIISPLSFSLLPSPSLFVRFFFMYMRTRE